MHEMYALLIHQLDQEARARDEGRRHAQEQARRARQRRGRRRLR